VDALEWGFNEINECIEDFVCDIPKAAEIVQSCVYASALRVRTNATIQSICFSNATILTYVALTTVRGLWCRQDAKLLWYQAAQHKQGSQACA
jgi:hypothetical protein